MEPADQGIGPDDGDDTDVLAWDDDVLGPACCPACGRPLPATDEGVIVRC